jgi:hypothetical protein
MLAAVAAEVFQEVLVVQVVVELEQQTTQILLT